MSLTAGEQAAREALRARQGAGARYDAASAPAEDLLLARRGTAYFARKLGELSDAELDAPSLREDVRRRALIAQVGYHARALALAVAAARAGRADPMCQRFCGPSGQHRARPEPAPNPIPVRGTFLAGPGRPIAFERRDRRSRV